MSARLQLLLVTHEFRPKCGGIAVYTEELARAACGQFKLEVWAPAHSELDEGQFPFAVTALPIKGTHNLACVTKTMSALRKRVFANSPDILCLAEPGPLLAAMYMQCYSKLPGRAVVSILHGSEIQRFTRNPVLRLLFRKMLRKNNRIGVVSEYNRAELLKAFPELDEKTCVVSGALRHDFDGDVVESDEDSDKLVLLTVARIHPRKGQLAVIEALSRLPDSVRRRVSYQVVGPVVDASYRDELERVSKNAGVELTLTGEVSDSELGKCYGNADIFALTSMPFRKSIEGYGLVYLEAGHYRLPSVAHRIGGVPEAVLDEKTGLLADPDDRDSLVRSIRRLIDDAALRKQFGENAYQHAHKRGWDDNVQTLFDGL